MLVSLLKSLLLLSALYVSLTGAFQDPDLDTTRDIDFLRSDFIPGKTYLSTTILDTTTRMVESGDMPNVDTTMHMEIGNKLVVTELEEGGKELDMEYERLLFETSVMGQTMSYDSQSKDQDSLMASIFDGLVGSKIVMILDDENNVVDVESPLGEQWKAMGGDEAQQFDQMTRVAKALPEAPVKPGDSWDYNMDSNGVVFTGTGALLGYLDYEGHDVAVVVLEGEMDMDMSEVEKMMNSPMAGLMAGVKVKNGRMTSTTYFDPKDKLSRWVETTTTMTMEMPSPLDPSTTLTMEIETVAKVTFDIDE